jgi:hypothetical protein
LHFGAAECDGKREVSKNKRKIGCWQVIKSNKRAGGRIDDILGKRNGPTMWETDEKQKV